ncbi:MAG: T9SS type A sorting domain-containing protein [Ignavibacteriaceae bacterium]|nr:T9SS type A sorting domain-containing protein [Ignavibacteriaceae bacterium]
MKKMIYTAIFLIVFHVAIKGQPDVTAPQKPQNFEGFSNEKHIDLEWYPNQEADLGGYKLYKRDTAGVYKLYLNLAKEKSFLSLYYGALQKGGSFKLSAVDGTGNESPLTDSVDVLTKECSDEEFMDMVQRATFRYFYDYAHPVSKLARERLGSGETVTTGGTGFGIGAILVGIERGFISRDLGKDHIVKMFRFLKNTADKFHGAFSHWLNGTTGRVIPFSQYDDGGDLVETAFLVQGILTARQYFDANDPVENEIRQLATQIWEGVEWTWYQRASFLSDLYWHWSPNFGWQMNMRIKGWNEAQIIYLLAMASPTYGVPKRCYTQGWAGNNYTNGNTYYGYKLFVGQSYGGPLFFAHYSFQGFDPRDKKDAYANYFLQNKHHTLINRAYCIANPYNHPGYNENCWGLTASDDHTGYGAHAPYSNDNGTITPTAGISSMPYTPTESIELIKYLYRTYGSQVWGEYGFKDAFNVRNNWYASSYLAIDQGPIINGIENHRTGLLWNKFMSNPEVPAMLDSAGFVPDPSDVNEHNPGNLKGYEIPVNFPNPFNPSTTISFMLPERSEARIVIYDTSGKVVRNLFAGSAPEGENRFEWNGKDDFSSTVPSGIYFYRIMTGGKSLNGKMVLQK